MTCLLTAALGYQKSIILDFFICNKNVKSKVKSVDICNLKLPQFGVQMWIKYFKVLQHIASAPTADYKTGGYKNWTVLILFSQFLLHSWAGYTHCILIDRRNWISSVLGVVNSGRITKAKLSSTYYNSKLQKFSGLVPLGLEKLAHMYSYNIATKYLLYTCFTPN